MKNKILSVIFCLLLFGGMVGSILAPDRYYSEREKRTLVQFPKITLSQIYSGAFGSSLERYFADQFPGRNGWVTTKTLAERLSGKKESGGVYFGKDGYLIDTNRTFSQENLVANVAALKRLSEEMDAAGIPIRIMLVPTASEVLSHKLPAFAPTMDQNAVLAYAEGQGLNLLDVSTPLEAHREEYIFYKTDHHWTSLGAYLAYEAWMEAKGETPLPLSAWNREVLCDNFRGTTYAKVNAPFAPFDSIEAYTRVPGHRVVYNGGSYVADSIYERKYLAGSDQYAVFLNGNQATTVVSGGGTGNLLILKDSYANCFAQFVVDDYAQTHLIDLRFFREDILTYIARNGITEVLVLYNIPNFAEDPYIGGICRNHP